MKGNPHARVDVVDDESFGKACRGCAGPSSSIVNPNYIDSSSSHDFGPVSQYPTSRDMSFGVRYDFASYHVIVLQSTNTNLPHALRSGERRPNVPPRMRYCGERPRQPPDVDHAPGRLGVYR